jgi:hypothetical protein
MRVMRVAVRVAAIVLALIGITAAVMRIRFPGDLAPRGEPIRNATFARLGIVDPFAGERAALVIRADAPYAAHVNLTVMHVGAGAVVLALMLLQFSHRVRNRFRAFHRWSGRVVVIAGAAMAAGGFYFGIRSPFGGDGERAAAIVFGTVFVVSTVRGVLSARRRDFVAHREWMIRAAAITFGIAFMRPLAAVLDILLTPLGYPVPALFVLTLWSGWIVSVATAELYIRASRALAIAAA